MSHERIDVVKSDITVLNVDAIVNAANNSLLGGGGVDGAIHKAAGPDLLKECEKLNGCPTGEAKLTKGYRLQAKYIIHTVGPVWYGGNSDEPELLASCYKATLTIAKKKKLKTIALPGISTGIYHFPKDLAATIAVNETKKFLTRHLFPEKVIFVTYDKESLEIYRKLLHQ